MANEGRPPAVGVREYLARVLGRKRDVPGTVCGSRGPGQVIYQPRTLRRRLERAIQSPNIVVLLKLAEVLEVPAAALISKMEASIRNPLSGRPSPK